MRLSYSNIRRLYSMLTTYRKFKKNCNALFKDKYEEPVRFEIWAIHHIDRTSKVYAFETMKEALSFVSTEDRLDTEIEYLFVKRVKKNCQTLRLNIHPIKSPIYKSYDICQDQKPT